MRVTRRYGLAAAGGALVSLCDRMHMAWGVLEYPDGGFLGQPWWVMPLFAAAGASLLLLHEQIAAVLAGPLAPVRTSTLAVHLLLFVAAYAATAVLSWPSGFIALVLAALWAPFGYVYRSPAFLGFAVLVAVLGPLFEAVLSATGAFRYLEPDLFGVPIWLPALYLWVALAVAGLARLPLR